MKEQLESGHITLKQFGEKLQAITKSPTIPCYKTLHKLMEEHSIVAPTHSGPVQFPITEEIASSIRMLNTNVGMGQTKVYESLLLDEYSQLGHVPYTAVQAFRKKTNSINGDMNCIDACGSAVKQ
jgi:hypothetical protein